MDDFVRNKLMEWGLSNLIDKFKDECIDKESLECLEYEEIDDLNLKVGLKAKLKKKLKLFKEKQNTAPQEAENFSPTHSQQEHEELAGSAQDGPSTSDTNNERRRRLNLQGECSKIQPPAKKQQLKESNTEEILCGIRNIMRRVDEGLHEDNTKLNAFLKKKICDLETDKRELVGVFGRTGAGKSSLINAVIGEVNLLPSGSVRACTSVMIKVEANMETSQYEAAIEFITKEEWEDELWLLFNILENNQEKHSDEDYRDIVEKLSAVYGEEWKNKSPKSLMDSKYFREIPEFLQKEGKLLTCRSAEELSAKFVKYTRSESSEEDDERVKTWYWPLVKCVTVRVPKKPLLQYVTLVDLPGSGDRNKSRDKMWKELVGSCSTVWIVTEINRAASEKETWEILESTCSLMGNGGQCQQISYICTKSDLIETLDDSTDTLCGQINKRNKKVVEEVQKEFNKQSNIKKHFSEECLKVFTVSSKEFVKRKHLKPDETGIPRLQKCLQKLNDFHSETLNYVSGAYGILSLMQGASSRNLACSKTDVCSDLEGKLRHQLCDIRKSMDETYGTFKKCLNEGVEKSENSCDRILRSILYPRQNRGFHGTLKCLVQNNGVHITTKGKQININWKLSSCLANCIDEEFRKTFPNEGKRGPFNGVINEFSLDTERLIGKYKDAELQLIFLKTEENKIKTKLNKIILKGKKIIYSSLSDTVEETMKECYKKAAEFCGTDMLKNMRQTLEEHVKVSKNIIFKLAKGKMLGLLKNLMDEIVETLEKTLNEGIELSLKTDDHSIPDFSAEFVQVKQYYEDLRDSSYEEI